MTNMTGGDFCGGVPKDCWKKTTPDTAEAPRPEIHGPFRKPLIPPEEAQRNLDIVMQREGEHGCHLTNERHGGGTSDYYKLSGD